MKVSRPILFIVILLGYICAASFGGIQSHNASVNSSPESILIFFIASLFSLLFPRKPTTDAPEVPVGIWRRFWAFNLDSIVAVGLIIPVGIIPILIVEYFVTGQWQWSYERNSWQNRDTLSIALVFGSFYGLYYYFYKHAAVGKATPGQYILCYRIIPANSGTPQFKSRVFHGAIALWLSIITLFMARNIKDGVYPWDTNSNTRAVSTT